MHGQRSHWAILSVRVSFGACSLCRAHVRGRRNRVRADENLWDVEIEQFGTSHAEIGAYLMGLWGLEYPVIEAIAYHHRPGKSLSNSTGLLTAVHFGDAFDRLKSDPNDGNGEDGLWELDRGYLDNLGVAGRISDWKTVCKELTERNVL